MINIIVATDEMSDRERYWKEYKNNKGRFLIVRKRMQIILWRSVIEIDWLSVYTSS